MRPSNPQFPHECRIYRTKGESAFSDGEIEVIYEGKCRKHVSRYTKENERVLISEYVLKIPSHDDYGNRIEVKALANDRVEVTDRVGTFRGYVIEANVGNLGTNVWFNYVKE